MALPLITAPNLKEIPGLFHAFTTRQGGVSEGPFASFNLGLTSGDEDDRVIQNYLLLAKEIGIAIDQMIGPRQVHGGNVEKVDTETDIDEQTDGHQLVINCDALCTDLPRRFLVIRAADCYPILLVDARHRAVAAVHAGWRGTLARIVPNAIEKMKKEFGTDPSEIQMAVGPGISMKAFEISLGVAALFQTQLSASPQELKQNDTKAHADLAAINVRLAQEEGVRVESIWKANLCTFLDAARFYSYRRDGKHSGRQIGIIGWAS